MGVIMSRSKTKRRTNRKSKRQSIWGPLLLELIAVVAFVWLMSLSGRAGFSASENQPHGKIADNQIGTMVAGFVSDQLHRHGTIFE